MGRQPHRITVILAQWRRYPRLKKRAELQVYRPQESTWKPPLPQYATTLCAMQQVANRKIRNFIETNNLFSDTFCVCAQKILTKINCL
jgi:hypothetical protein